MGVKKQGIEPKICHSTKDFFAELVLAAQHDRRIQTSIGASGYLIDLLEHYVASRNLFASAEESASSRANGTLAETLLTALNSEKPVRMPMLKQLGDSSLYISGFFGDSLKRKLVDVDYYAEIGGSAYNTLAKDVTEEEIARLYSEFSHRFLEFVDLLTYISQRLLVQTNGDLLRLYDRYISTGSELARDQLIEKGLITYPDIKKSSNQ